MTSFRNAAGTLSSVSREAVDSIVRAHNVQTPALVVSVCLTCQSISEAPDLTSWALIREEFDMTCCSPGATILPAL
jgi:hypothetical protein